MKAEAEKADRVKPSHFQSHLAVDGMSVSSQTSRGDAADAEVSAMEAKARELAQTKTGDDTKVDADDPRERERVQFSLALAAARQAEQEARQAEEAAQQAELTRFLEEAASGMDTWERKKRQSAAYEQAESETEAAASSDDEGSSPPDEAAAAESSLAKPSFFMRGDEDALMMAIAAEEAEAAAEAAASTEAKAAAEVSVAITSAPSIFQPLAAVRKLELAMKKKNRHTSGAKAAAEASVAVASAAPSIFTPVAAVRKLDLVMKKRKRYAITWLVSFCAISWLRAHVGAYERAFSAFSWASVFCWWAFWLRVGWLQR